MPLEGSALEEIMQLLEGYSEEAIGELVEKLGKDRVLSIDEVKAQIIPDANAKSGITIGIRRKRFIELLYEKNLVFTDPARDRIASDLSGMTEGFVGSDLESICREAGMLALREDATLVTRRHFELAQKKVHPMMNESITRRSSSTSKAVFPNRCSRRNTNNFFT
jgi:transitional endoplasmic reticulum ATPase